MLVLNIRTVAFLAALSTSIQSVLWITGYFLYVLAYSCVFDSPYKISKPYVKNYPPQDLSYYFILYLQGSDCLNVTEPTKWLSKTRWANSEVIVSILSIGAAWNALLLAYSIYMLVGLFKSAGAYRIINHYSVILILVSLYDVALVSVTAVDFSPLLFTKHYVSNQTSLVYFDSTLEIGYFSYVLTILLFLLSRFVCIWFSNAFFALCLLCKNVQNEIAIVNNSEQPMQRNNTPKSDLFKKKEPLEQWMTEGQDYKFFGKQKNGLSRWHVPMPLEDNLEDDEVATRWTKSNSLTQEAADPLERNDSIHHPIIVTIPTPFEQSKLKERNWKDVEEHIIQSDERWRATDKSVIPDVKRTESIIRDHSELKVPTFLKNIRESFRKTAPATSPPEIPQEDFPKQREGFTYGVAESGIFGVKLKHVGRASIPNERTFNMEGSVDSGDGGGDAIAYAISPVTGINPDEDSNNLFPFFPVSHQDHSALPFNSQNTLNRAVLGTPPAPPPDAPPLHHTPFNISFNAQMSLEEAIKTRRPLKSVRPALHTSC